MECPVLSPRGGVSCLSPRCAGSEPAPDVYFDTGQGFAYLLLPALKVRLPTTGRTAKNRLTSSLTMVVTTAISISRPLGVIRSSAEHRPQQSSCGPSARHEGTPLAGGAVACGVPRLYHAPWRQHWLYSGAFSSYKEAKSTCSRRGCVLPVVSATAVRRPRMSYRWRCTEREGFVCAEKTAAKSDVMEGRSLQS